MNPEELRNRIPSAEITFTTSRSGGPGGQNVNKVNTSVELRFNVIKSHFLSEAEKIKIKERLKNRINAEGELIITSQSERTQLMNKKKTEEKFFKLLAAALTEKRKRKPTRPTLASREERIESKKKRSKIKKLRQGSGTSGNDLM